MDGPHTSMEPLAGGFSGETFLATAGDEQTVVRIYGAGLRHRGPEAPEVDAAVLHLVRGLIPVPEVLEVRRGDPDSGVPGLLVTSLMPGERLESVLPHLDESELGAVGAELGILLGRLSHIAMPFTGTFADASLRIEPFTVTLPEWLTQHELGIPGLGRVVEEADGLEEPAGRTCLVHSDFNPKNVLVDPDTLAVTALLDWEFAHAGNRFADLGNLLRFEESPVLVRSVLAAYRSFVPDAPEDLVARARGADLWALMELASRAGENPVADRALARLQELAAPYARAGRV